VTVASACSGACAPWAHRQAAGPDAASTDRLAPRGAFAPAARTSSLPSVGTGRKEPWKELMPADGAGIVDIAPVIPAPDGQAYVYGYSRTLSDLYVVEGLK